MPKYDRITIKSILEKAKLIENKRIDTKYVLERWKQGRHLELPPDRLAVLLVKFDVMKRKVEKYVERIFSSLKGDIFSLVTPSPKYGVGKSQVAYLLKVLLEERGAKVQYREVDPASLEDGSFRMELQEMASVSQGFREPLVVIVDEVDLIVSPSNSPSKTRRLIEELGNAIIGFSEKSGGERAIVLVLSSPVESKIDEVAPDRLGRRLMNRLSFELPLEWSDIYDLLANIASLSYLRWNLDGEYKLYLLYKFVNDYIDFLRYGRKVVPTIGEIVALSASLIDEFSNKVSGITEQLAGKLDNNAEMGRVLEQFMRKIFRNLIISYRFEHQYGNDKYPIESIYSEASHKHGQRIPDLMFNVTLGGREVGKIAVEITSERGLSKRKKDQLKDFSEKYPTLLIYLTDEDRTHIEKILNEREEIEKKYPIEVVTLPFKLLKYIALVDDLELFGILSKNTGWLDLIKAYVQRFSLILFNDWFSETELKQTRKIGTDVGDKRMKALEHSIEAALQAIGFETSGKKRRRIDNIKKYFSERLVIFNLEENYIHNLVEDILKEWEERGLGHRGSKYFMKDMWDEGEARNIALSHFIEIIKRS